MRMEYKHVSGAIRVRGWKGRLQDTEQSKTTNNAIGEQRHKSIEYDISKKVRSEKEIRTESPFYSYSRRKREEENILENKTREMEKCASMSRVL